MGKNFCGESITQREKPSSSLIKSSPQKNVVNNMRNAGIVWQRHIQKKAMPYVFSRKKTRSQKKNTGRV
jgi:hypothetical protein